MLVRVGGCQKTILVYNLRFIIISERFNIMSVKVAIRVRPFNQREKFLGCISCVDMRQNTTILYQNRQKNKKQHYFTFDYSLWSHDEFRIREDGYMYPESNKYVDQQKIYNVIGKEMLENAWQGYNCCLFAYGQTGAGKSYSIFGYGVNRGIIPMACEQIFQKIKKYQRKGQKQYEITLSMLEIYNEKVQDLFVPTSKRPQNGLKIRQNKTLGVYVQGLTKHQVFSYADIERRMEEGSKNRSLASTLMNQYSSRAHTIVLMEFVQKEWINKLKMNKKSSFINLVDLAGSERVAKTGISDNKDRLKQASNINKSLHTLGRVIQILAEQAAGKGKNSQVPYRDSSLTRILESALGGNSKTIMICAISPANDNYEETLSTLRYADQTKKIKNKPIVNQSAVDKIIRQLREQNQRLKKMLEAPQEPTNLMNSRQLMTETEKKEMRSNVRASMREVQKEIKKNLKSFAINTDEIQQEEDSLMMTQFVDLEEPSQFFSQLSFDLGNKAQVYITNLNEDELLNYKVRYSCEKDILITNKNNKKNMKGMESYAKIVLCGLGIQQNHARITRNKDRYFIQALSETSSEYTLLNGKPVYEKRQLQHNDRIILGINSVFIFKNNLRKPEEKEKKIDYQFAVNERQQEMENISLISPTSLNLFLSSNVLKNSPSRDIYSGPPTQAYNNAKKLFQQQNEKEILDKLSDIEKEFSKLVKQNEDKLKQKEQFYRNKLNQLKKEKEKQKEEKSTLQQKLMMKSIQSESLKTKNSQLEKLKQKLSKYNEEKTRRKKVRESMLLANQDQNGIIQEDIVGQFVDLEDPNRRIAHQIGIGPDAETPTFKNKRKEMPPKHNRNSYRYEELTVEECEDNEDVRNRQRKESCESLLLLDEDPITSKKKREKQRQDAALQELKRLKEMNAEIKRQLNKKAAMRVFQFRRLYNIKIKCQIDVDSVCSQCLKANQSRLPDENPSRDNSFISKYLPSSPAEDAELQEYMYKGKQKKRMITQEEMLFLEQQIIELQSKLQAKQVNDQEKFDSDEMLLNYSMDRLQQEINLRQSFGNRKSSDSYAEIQLNLTQDYHSLKAKPQLKLMINDFIQVLADTPELNVYRQPSLKIMPTIRPKPKLKQSPIAIYQYSPDSVLQSIFWKTSSNINIKIDGKKPRRQFKITNNEQFNYTFAFSFERNEKIYKKQLEGDQQLLNDVNCEEDEVYEEQIIIKKKTQTKSKQTARETDKQPNAQAKQIVKEETKIFVQFGTNTEVNDYQSSEREKINSFTAFLNEQLEQTRQNNTLIDPHFNDNIYNTKQFAQIGINIDLSSQYIIPKEEASVQINSQTRQIDVVTDINMETYQEFSQNNTVQHEDQIDKNLQQDVAKQQKQDEADVEQLLEKYIEGQQMQNNIKQNRQSYEQVEDYLQAALNNKSMNTSLLPSTEVTEYGVNTAKPSTKDHKMNTSVQNAPQTTSVAVNTSIVQKQNAVGNEDEIQKYIEEQQQEEQITNYLSTSEKQQDEPVSSNLQNSQKQIYIEYENQIVQIAKITQLILQNKIKAMSLHSHQLNHLIYHQKQLIQDGTVQLDKSPQISAGIDQSPIHALYDPAASQIKINEPKLQRLDITNEAISLMIEPKHIEQIEPRDKSKQQQSAIALRSKMEVQMIDEQVQTNIKTSLRKHSHHSGDNEQNQDSNKSSSNQYEAKERNRQKSHTHFQNKQKQLSNSQEIADKFNLSFSEIEKHEMSYQEMSVMGFDGLLKEEELNHKIKMLEDKIKQLQIQQQPPPPPAKTDLKQQQIEKDAQGEVEDAQINASLLAISKRQDKSNSRYIPIKKNKKKKKKSQMNEQERKEHEIEKEIQAKIIQCNNENIINERNLQIHKRKREAEELRKILVKKEKVELQKQLLVLIPMIRRFNLIAREMKRLVEGKISVEYRNFSHYEMIEVLKNYSANKRRSDANSIQIKIVVLNCEEGRIYTWPTDVFKNRFEIAEQTFEKYLENNEDPLVHRGDDRSEKAKDPFWDPVDFIPQGIGYLSMEVLLYNLSYEGYVSLVYKSNIIAKIYISITPVKVKRHTGEDESAEEESELEQMEIFNIRSLLEKDLYFTISIESIKFMKSEERQKLDESTSEVNLTALNSNIIKYNISYQLLEQDYKLVTFTTHEVDFVADKQFKKIDYMRRHSFQNISESTLAYMSDCPIKFTLNVMKDYHHEVLNASFNNDDYTEDNDHPSELDKSMNSLHSDDKSERSRNNSVTSDINDAGLRRQHAMKSDFSKKPSIIYENTELINKLESEAKKEQEKRDKAKKLEESRNKNSKAEKGEKDKDCTIY